MKKFIIISILLPFIGYSATNNEQLGKLTPMRTCINVLHYDITVKVVPEQKYIEGKNSISYKVIRNFNFLQLDFGANMQVDSIVYNGKSINYTRDRNAIIVNFKTAQLKNTLEKLTIYFKGNPIVAVNPPWNGGFVWAKDSLKNDWVGLACESLGASIWLPCKDHWSDEADSINVHLSVPENLVGVSNGKLVSIENEIKGYKTYNWQVKNTINNYNISINIGNYTLIQDTFYGINTVPLNYYVLSYNKAKAQVHFKQVKTMLKAFEHYFGKYPFATDGYKLVETPYWGMEHQSCIAYGNNYKNNAFGFDFIIVHESGHEWFANSITASDAADMWIHESFTTYSEALFVEYTQGKNKAIEYLFSQRPKIKNLSSIQGVRGVFYHGQMDSDMYYKGSWMLHTMRSVLHNDSLWFNTIYKFSTQFYHQIITTEDVVKFFNQETKRDWTIFFKQYLTTTKIPVLEYKIKYLKGNKKQITYQFKQVVKGFEMPLTTTQAYKIVTLNVTNKPQTIILNKDEGFTILQEAYLINIESK